MLNDVKDYFRAELGLPDEMIGEFVDSFLVSFDNSAADLRAILDAPEVDFLAVRRATHTMKGFAQTSGASDLLEASLALNASAHAADAAACRAGAQSILDLHARYRTEASANGGALHG